MFFGFTFVLLVFDQGERRVLRVDPISDPPGHVLISCSRRANLSSTAGLASGRITPYPMTPKRMYPSEMPARAQFLARTRPTLGIAPCNGIFAPAQELPSLITAARR